MQFQRFLRFSGVEHFEVLRVGSVQSLEDLVVLIIDLFELLMRSENGCRLYEFCSLIHAADSLRNIGGIKNLQCGNIRGRQLTFLNHRRFFALVEQSLAGTGAVNIQKQKHHKCNAHIHQRIAELHVAISALGRSIIS